MGEFFDLFVRMWLYALASLLKIMLDVGIFLHGSIKTPTYFFTPTDCKEAKALGMESGEIRDEQITASSQWSDEFRASKGRVQSGKDADGYSAWAASGDASRWFQVDFQQYTIVTGISTQGRRSLNEFVKSYTISFGDDGKNFYGYKPAGTFKVK